MNRFHKVTPETTNYIKSACNAVKASLYRRLCIKYRIAALNIYFNSQCIAQNIIPKYINLQFKKTQSSAAAFAVGIAKKAWLKRERHEWYVKRDAISHYLLLLYTELTRELHWIEWIIFDDIVRQKSSEIAFEKRATIERKLKSLLENNKKSVSKEKSSESPVGSDNHFGQKIINLSEHTFEANEISLLEKGLKYVPKIPVSIKDIKNFAVDCEIALRKENAGMKHIVAQEMRSQLRDVFKTTRKFPEFDAVNSIKSTLKSENLIIQKADKGNAVVIMKKCDYIEKCNTFIEEHRIEELQSNPTAKFQQECKNSLKSCTILFKWHDVEKLTQMNPSPPRFFGLPKIHKPGVPIRPVISNVTAPNHLLARRVNDIFREQSKFAAKYSVQNSFDFINRVSKVHIPSKCILVSFDVSNLFTSVPPKEAIDIAETILVQKSVPYPVICELVQLLQTCAFQNYFKFNGKYFKQPNGLAMGSPLSPILADIYMDHFEKNLFSSSSELTKNVLCWYRYVDDVFCVWGGSKRQLQLFLTRLNSLNKNLKFTIEVEENNSLPFLDLKISKLNNKLDFSIFRKDSYTDQVIHFKSRHCFSQKLSAFHAMIHRLVNVPMSPENTKKELSIIKLIAINNGYNEELVEKLYRKKLNKIALKDIYSTQPPQDSAAKWHRILYLDDFSQKVCKKLPKDRIKIANYNKSSLRSLLSHTKDRIPCEEKSGVYKLKCECGAIYIGQTGRKFQERVKEHQACVRNQKMNSQFAKHLIENNHRSDFNFEILHVESKGYRLDALEQLEIFNSASLNGNIVNEFLYASHSPLLKVPTLTVADDACPPFRSSNLP
jgi:hypothetical protein